MEKRTKQLPVYEEQQVQVGVRELDVWVTSDGNEFYHEDQAENHEYKLKVKQKGIGLPFDPYLYYFESKEQAMEAVKRKGNYSVQEFDEELFSYPDWFVIYDSSDNDEDDYYNHYDMKTFDEFKVFVMELLESAKS